jgi:hypothetical protein
VGAPKNAGGVDMALNLPCTVRAERAFAAHFTPRRKETPIMKLKALASAAALAVLALGSVALADNTQLVDPSQVGPVTAVADPMLLDETPTTAPASQPVPAQAAPAASAPSQTTSTPVMFLLSNTGVGQWLANNKFNITGFVDAGYFVDTNSPNIAPGAGNAPQTLILYPGAYSNRFMLDQLDLTLSKSVDTTKSWDWGFLFENGYGIDDSYTHSDGALDNRAPGNPRTPVANQGHPHNQYDILQANASLLVPLGTGLTLTGGKFVGILGQEVINPTGNLFYTHSYSFDYGVAGTVTGIEGAYTFSKLVNGNDWTMSLGGTNGWNQSLRDNNSAVDFLGQFKGNVTSALGLVFNLQEGPEATADDHDYWTDFEFIPTWTVSDQLTLTGDFLYGDAPHGATVAGANSAQWYGGVIYASYKLNGMFTFNARGEWYREQGVSQYGTAEPFSANYYEGTAGVQIHPLPNDNIFQFLQFRPEIRVDNSDHRAFNPPHDGGIGDYSEVTFAVDAIMQF